MSDIEYSDCLPERWYRKYDENGFELVVEIDDATSKEACQISDADKAHLLASVIAWEASILPFAEVMDVKPFAENFGVDAELEELRKFARRGV